MPRRSLLLLAALAALMLVPTTPALAGQLCSNTADVSWEVDHATVTVTGVFVEVEGCDDGEFVGIELITDDGDLPDDGPLPGQVEDEVAYFDISDWELRVEPVTGIRVYLEVHGVPTPVVTITVEQRFFNPAGNEQVGRSHTTQLIVSLGGTYSVPGAPDGYREVACDGMNLRVGPDEPEPQEAGSGEFEAERSGLHRVCYQMIAPGTGAAPPGQSDTRDADEPVEVEEPEVLDAVLDRDDPDTADDESDRDAGTTVLDDVLARTGLDLGGLLWLGFGLLLLGSAITRSWRRSTAAARQDEQHAEQ